MAAFQSLTEQYLWKEFIPFFFEARPILEISCIFKEIGSRDVFFRELVKNILGLC